MKLEAYDILIFFLGLCLLFAGIWITAHSLGAALSVVGSVLIFVEILFTAIEKIQGWFHA